MNTGAYRHRVTLDVPVADGTFEPLDPPDWWCAYEDAGTGQVRLTGHHRPGVTLTTRVHVRDRIYHVTAIENRQERDRVLVLACTSVYE
jgi:hypothetical protein